MRIWFSLLLLSLTTSTAVGENLRICTQNLHRLGERNGIPYVRQEAALVDRIAEGRCDLIAVQEVFGETQQIATRTVRRFVGRLEAVLSRHFDYILGEVIHDTVRSAVLWDKQKFDIVRASAPSGPLPKLTLLGPPHGLSRKSVGTLLKERSGTRKVFIASIHLKSRVGGYKDRTKTDYEVLRMESSEQVRKWAQEASDGVALTIIAGDRNAPHDSPSARIMAGIHALGDFRNSSCALNAFHKATCEPQHPAIFHPMMERRLGDRVHSEGSFRFRGKEELIDEIWIGGEVTKKTDLRTLNTRFVGQFGVGSDHKMITTEISW